MLRRSLRQLSRKKNRPSPFANLAGELVLCIADFLPTAADISSFSRVNKAVYSILFDYLLTFNIKNDRSQALVYAAKCNQISLALNLLRLGADVEAWKLSRTPLSWAITNGNFRMVEILLEAGARAENEDIRCQGLATFYSRHCRAPLACAIINNFDDIALLLLQHINDVNAKVCESHKEGTLNLAAKYGSVNIVRRLLEMGANPNPVQVKREISPLQSVLVEKRLCNHDVVQIVLLLLEYGAAVEVSRYQEDERFGITPHPRQLGEYHRDPRIRAIFSKGQPPLMSMGASETSGPWLSLITNEEETGLWDSNENGEDFDLGLFKIDVETRLLALEKPFPQPTRLETRKARGVL